MRRTHAQLENELTEILLREEERDMKTALDEAARHEEAEEYLSAVDAFAESNGFLGREMDCPVTWAKNLMAGMEAQGVLDLEEAE